MPAMTAYRNGTISVTNGLNTVTGTGTNWDSSMIGQALKTDDYDIVYEISAVPSATSITLASVYGGTTGGTKNYVIGSGYFAGQVLNKLTNLIARISPFIATSGDDSTITLDKTATGDESAIYFRVGTSGRARLGIIGNDDIVLETSSNGTTWVQVFKANVTDGRIDIPGGGLVDFLELVTARAGIKIGGTAAANLLSVVDAGTWTPVLTFGGLSTGITYSTQTGTYVRIGDLVLDEASILLTSKGTATGAAEITGLPFTPAPLFFPGILMGSAGMSGLNAPLVRSVTGPKLALLDQGATGFTALNDTHFSNTSNFRVLIMYKI